MHVMSCAFVVAAAVKKLIERTTNEGMNQLVVPVLTTGRRTYGEYRYLPLQFIITDPPARKPLHSKNLHISRSTDPKRIIQIDL
jgi:hypothetical protein